MNENHFVGALLRCKRLEKNWSQETLCHGICTTSYLSKIEQGKVTANAALIRDLFAKLNISWDADEQKQCSEEIEALYESIFSGADSCNTANLSFSVFGKTYNRFYLDYLVIEAYCNKNAAIIPEQLRPLLDSRQNCLLYILEQKVEQAHRIYPCALSAQCLGILAYQKGDYVQALENLQHGYDLACQNGYARIMMICQAFTANCYSDLQNIPNMLTHYKIARRLARDLNEQHILRAIEYNIASTQIECGDYESAYRHFSNITQKSALDLHKLAICCERMGKREEAQAVLDQAQPLASGAKMDMFALIRYRVNHESYLKDAVYGKMLLETFERLRREMPAGYAVFHLPWVEEWCIANRQYRMLYEISKVFPDSNRKH